MPQIISEMICLHLWHLPRRGAVQVNLCPEKSRGKKTTDRVSSRSLLFRGMALFMGASFIAYLFGVAVHEVGHYCANTLLGVPEKGIVLHPFDLSYNIIDGDLSVAFGTQLKVAFAAVLGPLFDMLFGVVVSLLLWRKRSPALLPILMWGSMGLLQEGGAMIISIMDYPDLIWDWGQVMLAGVPIIVVGLLAIAMLIVGSIWMLLLLPLAGLGPDDTVWNKLVTFLSGLPMLLLGAVVYLTLLGSSEAPTEMVLKARTTALSLAIIHVTILAFLHKPLFSFLDRISHTDPAEVRWWPDALVSLGFGAAIFAVQILFFN
jgi:hypothetical protein